MVLERMKSPSGPVKENSATTATIGFGQRHNDLDKDAEVAGTVHASRFVQIARNGVEIALHQVRIHRDHPGNVDQHQRHMAVDQPQQLRQHEDGDQRRELRDHLQQQKQHQAVLAPLKRKREKAYAVKLTLIKVNIIVSRLIFIEFQYQVR
jgi:hypothetical protein